MGFFLRKSWIWWVLAALLATLVTWLLNWWRHRGEAAAAGVDDAELRAARGLAETHKARVSDLEAQLADHKAKLAERSSQVTELDGRVAGLATLTAAHDEHKQRADALAAELDAIKSKASNDVPQVASLTAQLDQLTAERDGHASRIAALEADLASRPAALPPLDLAAAASVIGSPVKMDDIEVVEGIGPKIGELFNGNGITTWSALARTDSARLRQILDDGGPSFRVAEPASWPHQAALLSNGRWAEFKALTDELVAGRYAVGGGAAAGSGVAGFVATPAAPPVPTAEQLSEGSAIVGTKLILDDLKVVEGIGPAIEGLLNGGGIATWRQLEAASTDRLKQVLEAAGSRFAMHDPTTWPRQAGLLADAKWAEFKALTDELDGGRAV